MNVSEGAGSVELCLRNLSPEVDPTFIIFATVSAEAITANGKYIYSHNNSKFHYI